MFRNSAIEYSATKQFQKLVLDYLASSSALNPFIKYPFQIEEIEKIIADKKKNNTNRELLVNVLQKQYNGIPNSEIGLKQISSLLDENTFTVTCAHQPNLFSGPLYVISKTISTINFTVACKKKFPSFHFVPVYWIGSEDHDLEELNHVFINGRKIEWQSDQSGAIGRMNLSQVDLLIEQIKQSLLASENTNEVIDMIARSYSENRSMADALKYLLNELFGEDGLIILDQDDLELKNEFSVIMKDELIEQKSFAVVQSAIQQLEAAGYHAQVNPREINLFYLGDNFRERIIYDSTSDEFQVLKTDLKFSKEEILKELNDYPERFSPNVILRPLFQEKVLPNLALIGGSAEVAYWLELKSLFDLHKINLPMIVLRNHLMMIDQGAVGKLQKLGLNITDLFDSEDELIRKFLDKNSTGETKLGKELKQLENLFDEIVIKAETADSTLKQFVLAEKQKLINSMQSIQSKILKAQKRKQDEAINQIKKLKEKLFPDQSLQERHENFISFYSKYGKEFISALKKNLHPFEKRLTVLTEEVI